MDPQRPPPPPIPSGTGTATGSSAPAATSGGTPSGSGSTGHGVTHFFTSIVKNFRRLRSEGKKWMDYYLETFDAKRDTVYDSLGADAAAKCTPVSLKHEDERINTIMFNPYCFGKPLLWNVEDTHKQYKPLVAWSKWTLSHLKDPFSEKPNAESTALVNLKNYLSVRPVSRDLDRWTDYWHDCDVKGVRIPQYHDLAISGHPDLKGTSPPDLLGGSMAMSVADLLDWENVRNGTVAGVHTYVLPFIPTYRRFNWGTENDVSSDYSDYIKTTLNSHICCHGTNAYALYTQLYHGRLKASSSADAGERFLSGKPGVYCFQRGSKQEDKLWTNAYGSELGVPGMLYFFMWEVICDKRSAVSSSGGAAKDQWVFAESGVRLLNLHVFIRKVDDIPMNEIWMFQDKDTNGYNSLLEAHPLDPSSGFNTKAK